MAGHAEGPGKRFLGGPAFFREEVLEIPQIEVHEQVAQARDSLRWRGQREVRRLRGDDHLIREADHGREATAGRFRQREAQATSSLSCGDNDKEMRQGLDARGRCADLAPQPSGDSLD